MSFREEWEKVTGFNILIRKHGKWGIFFVTCPPKYMYKWRVESFLAQQREILLGNNSITTLPWKMVKLTYTGMNVAVAQMRLFANGQLWWRHDKYLLASGYDFEMPRKTVLHKFDPTDPIEKVVEKLKEFPGSVFDGDEGVAGAVVKFEEYLDKIPPKGNKRQRIKRLIDSL